MKLAALLLCAISIVFAQDDAALLLSRAVALARDGRAGEARATLEHGCAAYPSDKRFLVELAGLDYLAKDLPSAAARLRAALRLDPADEYATEFLATIELMRGNLEASLVQWNRLGRPVLDDVRLFPPPPLASPLRERAIPISAGQVLTLERLRAASANIDRLGVFGAPRFDLAPSAAGRFALTIGLVDTANPWRGWPARLLTVAGALPYQTLLLDRPNIAQRAINLSTLWRWDPNKRRIAIDLAAPWRDDPRYRYRLFLDARDERWDLTRTYSAGPLPDLRLRRIEAGADFTVAFGPRFQWTPGVRVARAWYGRATADPLFENYTAILARNQFDAELWRSPERRVRLDGTAWLETGSIFRGSRSRYGATAADFRAVWGPFARDASGIVRASVSAGGIFGSPPLDRLFVLGMERDNDLWLRGHVATRDGRKGNAPMGRDYALTQIDFQRGIFHLPLIDVSAGPFFDTGWVESQRWMRDAGLQAEVAVLGKLRWILVYGRDLRDGRGVFYTAVRRVIPAAPPR